MKLIEKIAFWTYYLVLLAIILVAGARLFGITSNISPGMAWSLFLLSIASGLVAGTIFPLLNWLTLGNIERQNIPAKRYFYEIVQAWSLLVLPIPILIHDLQLPGTIEGGVFVIMTIVMILWFSTRLVPQYFNNRSRA